MSQLTYATIDNMTFDNVYENYTAFEDTKVSNSFTAQLFQFKYFNEPDVQVSRQTYAFVANDIARGYYILPSFCYSNLTCVVLHLYSRYSSEKCQPYGLWQQIDNLGNSSWSSLNNTWWGNQPCGTTLDNIQDCNATLVTYKNVTRCKPSGMVLFNITSAYAEQCNAPGLQVQLILKLSNETGGIDSEHWFVSKEGYAKYGNWTRPYIEVFYDGESCGYDLNDFQLSGQVTTTVLYSPVNESVIGILAEPLAGQLGLSYENAALLSMFFIALVLGLMALSIDFLEEHRFEVFGLAFTGTLVLFTVIGYFPLWLLIIILIMEGLLIKQRLGR
jgi:hypothetical protein